MNEKKTLMPQMFLLISIIAFFVLGPTVYAQQPPPSDIFFLSDGILFGYKHRKDGKSGYIKSVRIDTSTTAPESTITFVPSFHNDKFSYVWLVTADKYISILNGYFINFRGTAKIKSITPSRLDSTIYILERERIQDSLIHVYGSLKAALASQEIHEVRNGYKNVFLPFEKWRKEYLRTKHINFDKITVRYDLTFSKSEEKYYCIFQHDNVLEKWMINIDEPIKSKIEWSKSIRFQEEELPNTVDTSMIYVDTAFFSGNLIFFMDDDREYMVSTGCNSIYGLSTDHYRIGKIDFYSNRKIFIKNEDDNSICVNGVISIDSPKYEDLNVIEIDGYTYRFLNKYF